MRFGQNYADVQKDINEGSGDYKSYIRYFKNAETTFRILEDPDSWLSYWEHFNPSGFPFPCTQDKKTCPGCTSDNEKMKKASRKVAFNVLQGDYVNVYKVPKTVAEKLENRAQRIGTLKDRDYTITKIQSKNSDGSTKTDYDIEGQDKIPLDLSGYKLLDVEELLGQAFEESWGSTNAEETKIRASEAETQDKIETKVQEKKPPFEQGAVAPEPKVWTEEELRSMDTATLIKTMHAEGMDVPEGADQMSPNDLVDWLLEQ